MIVPSDYHIYKDEFSFLPASAKYKQNKSFNRIYCWMFLEVFN